MMKEQLKQQGKLADIQSKERSANNKSNTDLAASEGRSQAKKELALLQSDMKIAEKLNEESRDEL